MIPTPSRTHRTSVLVLTSAATGALVVSAAVTELSTQASSPDPATTSSTRGAGDPFEPADRSSDDAPATPYTLTDAADPADRRVADVECEYLTKIQSDAIQRVTDFRADRDRFFDIDSDVVQAARQGGMTFTEIAADHGYSSDDVQDGAAEMHGFCFTQLIGPNLSVEAAEERFQETMVRFAERADVEPVGGGDGRPVGGGPRG